MEQTLLKFNQCDFGALDATDAQHLSDHLGADKNIIQKTIDEINDKNLIETTKWFLPYLIATNHLESLPFSENTQSYLKKHPVYPDQIKVTPYEPKLEAEDDIKPEVKLQQGTVSAPRLEVKDDMKPEVKLQQETVSAPRLEDIKPEVKLQQESGSAALKSSLDQRGVDLKNHVKFDIEDPTKNTVNLNDQSSIVKQIRKPDSFTEIDRETDIRKKTRKAVRSFSALVEFTMPTSDLSTEPQNSQEKAQYFKEKVVPYITTRYPETKSLIKSDFDESIAAIYKFDSGKILTDVGLEMLRAVIRASGNKYSEKRVSKVISLALRGTQSKTIEAFFTSYFPYYPASLKHVMIELKSDIMNL